jgi:GNAT superfamily N-acetyltransferase
MQLTVRRASSVDAEAAATLYLRARRAAAAARTIPPLAHADDDVRDWMARVVIAGRECWLAQRPPDTAVGLLVLDKDWIDQLYVDPEMTGAGIGAELMAVAKRERPRGLRLWTFVSNEGAQRFYVRHGFREVQRTDGRGNEERAADAQYEWSP